MGTRTAKAKHTPGPWTAYFNGPAPEVRGDARAAIAHWQGFDDSDRSIAEHQANARLMAAAPDLLASCKDMLEQIERMYPLDWQGTKSTARAAIRKAEGTQP